MDIQLVEKLKSATVKQVTFVQFLRIENVIKCLIIIADIYIAH